MSLNETNEVSENKERQYDMDRYYYCRKKIMERLNGAKRSFKVPTDRFSTLKSRKH